MSTTIQVAAITSMNADDAQKDTNGGSGSCKSRANAYQKEIKYDRASRDYALYLDSELVGFARTYYEADVTLDQLVFELLSRGGFREAA